MGFFPPNILYFSHGLREIHMCHITVPLYTKTVFQGQRYEQHVFTFLQNQVADIYEELIGLLEQAYYSYFRVNKALLTLINVEELYH